MDRTEHARGWFIAQGAARQALGVSGFAKSWTAKSFNHGEHGEHGGNCKLIQNPSAAVCRFQLDTKPHFLLRALRVLRG